ncbi:MAG: type II secretion system F family protein [Pirellulales bacterium]
MPDWRILLVFLAIVGAILAGVYVALRAARLRRVARQRLRPEVDEAEERVERRARPFARRHYLLPWLVAAVVFALGWFLLPIPWMFVAAFSIVVGLLGWQVDAIVLQRRQLQIESQLADSIDLMVAAVKVGSSIQAALESCQFEARAPLRGELEEVLGRIRYGDDPRAALDGLAQRVPLETFQLFVTTLAVNMQVGGSLASTLAAVGRTIRDRIELARRIQSITMQARASIVAIMLVTYFLAVLMWRNDPERMAAFLSSTVGSYVVAGAILAQGVGIAWIASIIKPRF